MSHAPLAGACARLAVGALAVGALAVSVVGCSASDADDVDDAGSTSSALDSTTTASTSTSSVATTEQRPSGTATNESTTVTDDMDRNEEYDVTTADGELVDPTRGRRIPFRVYAPLEISGPTPIVLVSHGGSGSERGHLSGGHLGSTFAAGGFLTVHVGHTASVANSRQVDDRPGDITFVLDQLAAGALELPHDFIGTPDLARVGHTGHSFGAYTAHAVGGATFARSYTDARIDAIAPISPQGPDQFGAFDSGATDNTWTTVTIPSYNLIGGDEIDSNAVDTVTRPGWRLTPFRRYPPDGDKFVTVIAGQSHSDMWRTGSDEVKAFVADEILAFLSIYVAGDASLENMRLAACSLGTADAAFAITDRRPSDTGSMIDDCI